MMLRLTQYRIPKTALLGRFISVDPKGNVTTQGNPKIMYASMMKVRTFLLGNACGQIFKALTIATRYSVLRKQFKDSLGNEIPIYDY
jgi:acyl-CoA oxidase